MNSLTISVELCSESVDLVGKAQGRERKNKNKKTKKKTRLEIREGTVKKNGR